MIRTATFNAGTHIEDVASGPKSPSFFARLATSIRQSREQAASREIAKFIELNGGQLTDALEREISRRYGRSSF